MNEHQRVYWLAVAVNSAEVSFDELKHRRVIAQGWPAVSADALLPFVLDEDRQTFNAIFAALFKRVYPTDDAIPVARIFWDMLHLKRGDLIVAIEGTRVVGITELKVDAISSYRHDAHHEYANAVCYGSVWVDWLTVSSEFVPTAPAQSVPGIQQLQLHREQVLSAWKTHKDRLNQALS